MRDSTMQRIATEIEQLRERGAARFPPLCRSLMRSLPGNFSCIDCNAVNPEWASVTHGCLICLQCSGRHRSYGVQTSTVRSVDMDHWTADQVLSMLEGGNEQLQRFFERHNMDKTMAKKRYHTRAARFYAEHMAKHVTSLRNSPYRGREASRLRYRQAKKNNTNTTATAAPVRQGSSRCLRTLSRTVSGRRVAVQ